MINELLVASFHQVHIQQLVGMYFLGVSAWFLTGVDDWLIFAGVYRAYPKHNKSCILGFFIAVTLMLTFVVAVGQTLEFLGRWIFLGCIIPAWQGIRLFKENQNIQKVSKNGAFLSAFLGFALNCTDDISYNSVMIAGKSLPLTLTYLAGICSGATLMVISVIYFNKIVINDRPRIRAIVLLTVAAYILWTGLTENKELITSLLRG